MRWAERLTKFPDHHVQWSNKPRGACKPLQPEDGGAFQEQGFDVQGILIQFGAYGNEVVWWLGSKFHWFL